VVGGFTFIAVVSHYLYDRFQSRAYPNEKEAAVSLGWDLHAKKADISTEEVKRALDSRGAASCSEIYGCLHMTARLSIQRPFTSSVEMSAFFACRSQPKRDSSSFSFWIGRGLKPVHTSKGDHGDEVKPATTKIGSNCKRRGHPNAHGDIPQLPPMSPPSHSTP